MHRLTILLFTLASTASGQDEQAPLRVVRTGTLIVDPSRAPVPNGKLVIRGDTIVGAGTVDEPPDAEVLDLSGYTVLPGLIDAHTHLAVAR